MDLMIDRILRVRAQAQGFTGRDSPSPVEVVKRVVAVQAQELPAGLLSVRARSRGLAVEAVEQARQEERSLVRTWCLRGTLHLLAAEDVRWLLPLLGLQFVQADRRRSEALGWDPEASAAGLRLLEEALDERQALTRPEVAALLAGAGLPSEGQAPVHMLYRAALEARICQGPDRGKEATYVRFEDWAGPEQPLPRGQALKELARRYLTAYAPARAEDLAAWSGLKIGEARLAWELLQDQMTRVDAGGETLWLLEDQAGWLEETAPDAPVVRMLPRYDTYLLGYASREWMLDPAFARRVNAGGGILHPVLLVDGRVRGIWKTWRKKNQVSVTVEPFEALEEEAWEGIEAEVGDIGRFLGEDWDLSHR